jgi:hypothetical protein
MNVTEVQQLLAGQLSLRARVGYTVLLVVALTASVAIASLWATEPALPMRTHIAFAVMTTIGAAWSLFAVWVLGRRRVLLGRDRVIAASIGLVATTAGLAGMLAAALWTSVGTPAYVGAAVQGALVVVAMVLLLGARRRVREIESRLRGLRAP